MINKSKLSLKKTSSSLTKEWDELAKTRHYQIASGLDISFDNIIVPTTMQLLEDANKTYMLDIGAGTGDLTMKLAKSAKNIIAIEPSFKSVEIAKVICRKIKNIEFINRSLESSAKYIKKFPITSAVAIMTLMAVPDLSKFAYNLSKILSPKTKFITIITHPWFWPMYWGYSNEPWFNYYSELAIEAPFVISKHRTEIKTTHIHRPLEKYIAVFGKAGFTLDSVLEPMPGPENFKLYPEPWKFPRFLGLRWERNNKV